MIFYQQCVIRNMDMKTLLKTETPLVVPRWLHLKGAQRTRYLLIVLFVLNLGVCVGKVTFALCHGEFLLLKLRLCESPFCDTQSQLCAVVMISSSGCSCLLLASLSKWHVVVTNEALLIREAQEWHLDKYQTLIDEWTLSRLICPKGI